MKGFFFDFELCPNSTRLREFSSFFLTCMSFVICDTISTNWIFSNIITFLWLIFCYFLWAICDQDENYVKGSTLDRIVE